MSRFVVHLALASLLAVLAAPATARSETVSPAAAEALFDEGRAAMGRGEYDVACERFRESDKLDPAVGTRFNLADCEEKRGRLATAWSLFRRVLEELPPTDDRRPIAEQRVQALSGRVPSLTLVLADGTPAETRVTLDGTELGAGGFGVPLPLDPGTHEFAAIAPGREPLTTQFSVAEGESTELPVRVGALLPPPAPPPAPASPVVVAAPPLVREAPPAPNTRRTWAYAVGGVGAAGLVLGTVTGIVALGKKSTVNEHCSDETNTCDSEGLNANDSGKTFATVSSISFIAGLLGVGAGTYLFLSSREEPARVSVDVRPGRGVLGMSGRF